MIITSSATASSAAIIAAAITTTPLAVEILLIAGIEITSIASSCCPSSVGIHFQNYLIIL